MEAQDAFPVGANRYIQHNPVAMKPENLTLSPTDAAPAVARTCPRCSHVRKPTDDAPAWQCPRCEVAYDKVLPAETASRHDRNKPVARTRPAPQRPWTLILLAGMVAAMLGLVGWKWQSRQAQTAERAARAQNDALAAQVNAERARLDGVQQLADAERQWRHNQGPQALSTVQTMANSGNARAMVLLSAMLSEGRDIAKDHAPALHKVAAQGSSTAKNLVRGRRNEVDHLNSFVALGIATSANRLLHALVRLLEKRLPAPASA